VDVHAVHRRVDDVVAAGAEIDAGVPARQVALRVRQDPVALERATDRAAARAELLDAARPDPGAVAADDGQTKRHRNRPCARGAVVATRILPRSGQRSIATTSRVPPERLLVL